jgi:hypothetical protein
VAEQDRLGELLGPRVIGGYLQPLEQPQSRFSRMLSTDRYFAQQRLDIATLSQQIYTLGGRLLIPGVGEEAEEPPHLASISNNSCSSHAFGCSSGTIRAAQ